MVIQQDNDIEELDKLFKLKGKKVAQKKYYELLQNRQIAENPELELKFKHIKCRSWSGVLVVTLVMRPDKFSCPNNCHYCPNEPGQPRSYLSSEPAVSRANENDFDPIRQFNSRLSMLHKNGHLLNKIEIIVLGGTFSSYPRDYQEEFCRDIFYAANTFNQNIRDKFDILKEQKINETAIVRIIGISLETRPDSITPLELMRFRKLGCTRVQIGVQHTDDDILKTLNRGHTVKTSIKAIKLLRNYGFKVDVHIMPDLPGSDPDKDKIMMYKILETSDFKPDYLKIYPCLDVEYTEIRNWKNQGLWKPYSEEGKGEKLLEVCMYAKQYSKYYIRFNRIQRDFPEERPGVIGYSSDNIRANFRQLLQNECKKKGISCKCIRCCEVKHRKFDINHKYFVDKYLASQGIEYFICCASPDRKILYGFVRLRLCKDNFQNCAFIRELHVYGTINDIHDKAIKNSTQHKGIGKTLMKIAELYSYINGYKQILVISGVGVREYYKRIGYTFQENGYYMQKVITFHHMIILVINLLFVWFKRILNVFKVYAYK
jgi:ELP3 family radical SAM enzyme/protein acetyltransferase